MLHAFARRLLLAVAIGIVPIAATAQPSPAVHRIGWLGHGNPVVLPRPAANDFLVAMRDSGYVEGRNLAIEYRYADGNVGRLPSLVAELVRLNVDVIIASGEPAALAAKRATTAIPVIMTEIDVDPVKAGLVASLARPEGNVTGLTSISDELWPLYALVHRCATGRG